MELEARKPKKYYRRINLSTNKSQEIENSKCINNYENSLISKIIKKNENLKSFTVGDKNVNNINTIKSNIKTLFSTDETKLKAIKYIIKSRKENNPSYKYRNIELSTQREKNRENSEYKEITSILDLNNKEKNNDDKEEKHNKTISYNKRHISELSSDNILFDQTGNSDSSHINKNISVDRPCRKYNKRIIIRDNSNKSNNIINNKKIIENNINTISSILNNNIDNDLKNNMKLNEFSKIKSELNSNENNLKNEEEKNCLNISFAEEGNFIQNEKNDTTERGDNNIKDNCNEEENNKILAINSHEISFRSFKNENDNYSNDSHNNSFDTKEFKIDNNLNKNKLSLIKSLENAFSICSNKNYPLKFKSENEIINYFKNGNIKIDKKPLTLIKDEELKNLDKKNKENEILIKKINKENESYINELSKLQKEIELLRQKLNEVYYAYQEVYKAYSLLKEENDKRNSFLKDEYFKKELNIESNYLSKDKSKKQKGNKNEPNYKLKNKNNNTEILLENNELKKDNKNDNGIISKAMLKFMNFFNEKKNKPEQ